MSQDEVEFIEQVVEIKYACRATVKTTTFDEQGNIICERQEIKEASSKKTFYPKELLIPSQNKLRVKVKMSTETVRNETSAKRARTSRMNWQT